MPRAACPRCALPFEADLGAGTACGRCLRKPPPWDAAFAPFVYRFPVDHLLRQLKFRRRLVVGRVLGLAMAQAVVEDGRPLPELIVPVPLHRGREASRGFNQSTELARALGRALDIEVDTHLCVRVRRTREQSSLDARQRRLNVRGSFGLLAAPRAAHVAIVDDVLTTGSTAAELTRLLSRAGVGRIEVWCCARAIPRGSGRPRCVATLQY